VSESLKSALCQKNKSTETEGISMKHKIIKQKIAKSYNMAGERL
jgi:hypothetical protein